MSNRIRWGILSTAKIGTVQVIPAMQQGEHCEISAIASRTLDQAAQTAAELGIPRAYGSYAELLADPDIDAIHINTPIPLHGQQSIQALKAGKHVACEKPLAGTLDDARAMMQAALAADVEKVVYTSSIAAIGVAGKGALAKDLLEFVNMFWPAANS